MSPPIPVGGFGHPATSVRRTWAQRRDERPAIVGEVSEPRFTVLIRQPLEGQRLLVGLCIATLFARCACRSVVLAFSSDAVGAFVGSGRRASRRRCGLVTATVGAVGFGCGQPPFGAHRLGNSGRCPGGDEAVSVSEDPDHVPRPCAASPTAPDARRPSDFAQGPLRLRQRSLLSKDPGHWAHATATNTETIRALKD